MERTFNAWVTVFYLLLAIVLEVAGITCMKLSDGFNRLEPSLLIFIFYSFSFIFLALTLQRLEVSWAYAVWSGLGTFLIAIVGVLFFHEAFTLVKAVSLGAIIVGVLGMKVSSR